MTKRTYPRTAVLVLCVFAALWPAIEMVLLAVELLPSSYADWYVKAAASLRFGLVPPQMTWPAIAAVLNTSFYFLMLPLGLVFGVLPALFVRVRGYLSPLVVAAAALLTVVVVATWAELVDGVRTGGETLGPNGVSSSGLLGVSYVFSGLACRALLMRLGLRGGPPPSPTVRTW